MNIEDIPALVRDRAKYLILDAVGIAFVTRHYPISEKTRNGLLDAVGTGTASVAGFQEKLPLRDTVIINGALVHGLDYDDTHPRSIVHPEASSPSTVLGFGEHCDVGGRELLTAYVTAMQSIIRIRMAAMGGLHRWGCAAGVNAAYLAKNGFVGPTCPYESRFGLYKNHLHDDE